MEISVEVKRAPLPADLDPRDAAAARAWLVSAAEQEVAGTGRLLPAMRVLLADAQLLIDRPFSSDEAEASVAVFRRLLATEGAIRGYREGELVADGTRMAAMLELDPADNAWAIWRPLATRNGGVGVWLAPGWTELGGTEPPLAAWLDSGGRVCTFGEARPAPTELPELQVRMATATLDSPVPDDAEAVADLVGRMLDDDVTTNGLPWSRVVAFRGATFELYELRGPPRSSVDDTIRAIAQSSRAEAIALVTGVVTTLHGEPRRGVATVAEAGGRRFERVIPLTFDDSGGAFPLPVVGWSHGEGELPREERWIGTPPSVPVALRRDAD